MDEMVTFSHDDVYNVEEGSSSAGIDEGDVLTVKDCLYALMLASANESANAWHAMSAAPGKLSPI